MKHEIIHHLDYPTAQIVAQKAVETYAEKFASFGFQSIWKNKNLVEIQFNVGKAKLNGTMKVEPKKLVLNMKVPLIFRLFSSEAIKVIDREAQVWIDKAKQGKLAYSG